MTEDGNQPKTATSNRDVSKSGKRRSSSIIDVRAVETPVELAAQTDVAANVPPANELDSAIDALSADAATLKQTPEHETPPAAQEPEPQDPVIAAAVEPKADPTPVPAPPKKASWFVLLVFIAGVVLGVGGSFGLQTLQSQGTLPGGAGADIAALKADIATLTTRLAKAETKAATPAATDSVTALEKRVAAVETSLKSSSDTAQAAKTDAAKALELASRAPAPVASVNPATPVAPAAVAAPPVDLAPLNERIAKIDKRVETVEKRVEPLEKRFEPIETRFAPLEAALAPKTDRRAPQDRENQPSPASQAAAVALIAQTLTSKVDGGAPFAAELAALTNLGVEPAKLAALQPLAAKGVLSNRALSDGFTPLVGPILAGESPNKEGTLTDKALRALGGLVRVRKTGELGDGSSLASLVTNIETALSRGDVDAALANWTKLPGPARAISDTWANGLKARGLASSAAKSIATDAVATLGKPKS